MAVLCIRIWERRTVPDRRRREERRGSATVDYSTRRLYLWNLTPCLTHIAIELVLRYFSQTKGESRGPSFIVVCDLCVVARGRNIQNIVYGLGSVARDKEEARAEPRTTHERLEPQPERRVEGPHRTSEKRVIYAQWTMLPKHFWPL